MNLAAGYHRAHQLVVDAGYGGDVLWARDLADVEPTDEYVLSETAWVIVCSGFRYAVARRLFPMLTACFCDWKLDEIDERCRTNALCVLNHEGKIGAILEIAKLVREGGGQAIVADAQDPPQLCRLPYIGKVTCWHLAKLLGVDCVKPDVHLQRAAEAAGFEQPVGLCMAIQEAIGTPTERLTVIDSVLWRYGEQQQTRGWPDWRSLFDPAFSIEPEKP